MDKQNWPYINPVDPEIYKSRTDWPKISIVTCSYNQGHYIEETILSVLNQNYPNLEYIVIDGGSTDNTVEIIKKYEDRITYWVSEPDRGQAHAINKGFEKCTGEIIGWINSDDLYLEKCFYYTAKEFIAKKVDIVSLNSILFHEDTKQAYLDFGKPGFFSYTIFSAIVPSHTTFWKKDVHQMLDENINCAVDYELWMRLFKNNKLRKPNLFGGIFRFHDESKSVLKESNYKTKWEADFKYISKKHKLRKPSLFLVKQYQYFVRLYKLLRKIQFKFIHQESTWIYFKK